MTPRLVRSFTTRNTVLGALALPIALALLGCGRTPPASSPASSQPSAMPGMPGMGGAPAKARPPATIDSGLGHHSHPIHTSNAEAQRFFDQGMVLVFGFNHEEAIRSFERAAQLDPQAAMPHWGIALALGPNINLDVEPPEWYYPTRESHGAALLLDGKAAEAETVFRADLQRNPRNPRSLFGLWQSLAAQNKSADADWVRRQFEAAWQGGGVQLRVEDL